MSFLPLLISLAISFKENVSFQVAFKPASSLVLVLIVFPANLNSILGSYFPSVHPSSKSFVNFALTITNLILSVGGGGFLTVTLRRLRDSQKYW